MKASKELHETGFDSDAEMQDRLIELSNTEGGAWVADVMPFSKLVRFKKFQSPSRVPDFYHDLTGNTIAYKGRLVGFTKAAQIREQNRGIGRG